MKKATRFWQTNISVSAAAFLTYSVKNVFSLASFAAASHPVCIVLRCRRHLLRAATILSSTGVFVL
jgi:hypothetical protein